MIILETVELLDILGNENRRRILQLLSFRPFYFNEMAKRLDVGPKAVISHLDMLERAGLIECYRDNRRRKYFRIADCLVMEVVVTPHTYGVRTYRPEGIIQKTVHRSPDLDQLSARLRELEEKRRQLRCLLEEVEAEAMETKRLGIDLIDEDTEDQLEAETLIALLSGGASTEHLAEKLRMSPLLVEDCLQRLAVLGKVRKKDDRWSI
ncbi:MAG: helix-turn-helix domain-containing protein [Euryarchaeota archaeon]|nr:helix-turn-helix domain-containing protein [Euryarchaeota archaeon]